MLSHAGKRHIAKIPDGLTLRKFEHGQGCVLVVALQRRAQLHNIFLSDLLRIHRPKCVLTPLQADHPWLIDAQDSDVETAWRRFVKTSTGRFLVNPKPQYFEDTFLGREKIASFHQGTFMQTTDSFEVSPHVAYSKHILLKDRAGLGANAKKGKTLRVDAYLTPLLWLHNNREISNIAVISGLPELVYRDQIVRQSTVHTLREYFTMFAEAQWNEDGDFSLKQHAPDLFLRPKAQYLSEVMRLACGSFRDSLAVVDAEVLPLLEEEWKKVPVDLRPLTDFLKINPFPSPTPFVDHVEMHVLLDFMLHAFLEEWYLPYKVYPYSAFGTLGVEKAFYGQALITWKYFYDQHLKAYNDAWNTTLSSPGRRVKKPTKKT